MENQKIYVLIEWINGRPVIDGAPGWLNQKDLIEHVKTLPTIQEITGVELVRTVCVINLQPGRK